MQLCHKEIFSKKVRFVFNENTDQFYLLKNLELYLIKIQISFMCKKKIRSVFNENTDQFLCVKKIRSTFNENADKFLELKNQI